MFKGRGVSATPPPPKLPPVPPRSIPMPPVIPPAEKSECKHSYHFMETETRGQVKVDRFYCEHCLDIKEIIRNKDGSLVELEGFD